jgi:hypothetical protein
MTQISSFAYKLEDESNLASRIGEGFKLVDERVSLFGVSLSSAFSLPEDIEFPGEEGPMPL